MKKSCLILLIWALLLGCKQKYPFENFVNADQYKNQTDFDEDTRNCEREKDKHSYKIEGRKFGFKGKDTGFLGCLKIRGWTSAAPPSSNP